MESIAFGATTVVEDCVSCEADSDSSEVAARAEEGVIDGSVDSPIGDDSLADLIALDSMSSFGERLQERDVTAIDMQSRYVGSRIGHPRVLTGNLSSTTVASVMMNSTIDVKPLNLISSP